MDSYTDLAKKAVEEFIQNHKTIDTPNNLSQEMYTKKAGVFVTLFYGNELRGCIGTYLPYHENIAKEIIDNAVSACSKDNRFYPITPDELPELRYEVSILSVPQYISDISTHDPQKYGIIVKTHDGRCGLLLPHLEGIDRVEQQIEIASQKGGINPLSDGVSYYQFTVEKHA